METANQHCVPIAKPTRYCALRQTCSCYRVDIGAEYACRCLTGLNSWLRVTQYPRKRRRQVGRYCRDHIGYHPVPDKFLEKKGKIVEVKTRRKQLRSVAIYEANKSPFDFVHLFASLHRGLPGQHMNVVSAGPVQVHWVIRDKGPGTSWMTLPSSFLLNKQPVTGDQAASA